MNKWEFAFINMNYWNSFVLILFSLLALHNGLIKIALLSLTMSYITGFMALSNIVI